jgi:transposase
MLFCFFDQEGSFTGNLSHLEWRSMHTYCDALKRLREYVPCKRPQNWQKQLIIHHDNAPTHRSFKVSQFLAKNSMTVVPHPPYSPDLAPCDFFLFLKLKLRIKGPRFDTIEEIREESQRALDTIPKRGFQECFQAWQKRWDRCILALPTVVRRCMWSINLMNKEAMTRWGLLRQRQTDKQTNRYLLQWIRNSTRAYYKAST